jgi:hypothetical protein
MFRLEFNAANRYNSCRTKLGVEDGPGLYSPLNTGTPNKTTFAPEIVEAVSFVVKDSTDAPSEYFPNDLSFASKREQSTGSK